MGFWLFPLLQADINAAELGGKALGAVQGNWTWLLVGIALIVAAVLFFVFFRKIAVNSLLGLAAWALLYFVIGVKMALIPSLVVSVVFGLAGVGALLVLMFFGVQV